MSADVAEPAQATVLVGDAVNIPGPVACHVAVTTDVLDVAQHLAAVEDPTCGAVVTFIGQVRDHDPSATEPVVGIEYSAHPDAEGTLAEIVASLGDVAEVTARSSGSAVRVAVSHRVGELDVGDLALVACVATAHRAQAYELSRVLVERIKAELPIWKKQLTVDGVHQWVGL